MAGDEKDEVPMLLDNRQRVETELRKFTARTRSGSMSTAVNSVDSYDGDNNLVGHTGPLRSERRTPFVQMSGPIYINRKSEGLFHPTLGRAGNNSQALGPEKYLSDKKDWSDYNSARKNEHLWKSGQLGKCHKPDCTECPTHFDAAYQKNSKVSASFDSKFHNAFSGDAKGWARRSISFLSSFVPGVMNPHARVVQQWNKFFVISCFVAIFVDPLFFLLLSVQKENKCIVINWPLTTTMVVFRSLTDFVYFLHMLLQFRLAYIAPESRVVGAGDLVDHPRKIAMHYIFGYFIIDLFVVLPLPQIMILIVLPKILGSSGANRAKNLLRAAVLAQYIPRLFRFFPLLAGQSPSGFTFESAWANFVINLLTFILAGHVVGSCWYLFGLQTVTQCLREACSVLPFASCNDFIDCGHGEGAEPFKFNKELNKAWINWKNNQNAIDCLIKDRQFNYGIYKEAVELTAERSIVRRYVYSLFWGFQQISTLAGNLVPSYFEWEVLFTMAIIGLGLLLFALLIGNMQNFLQALGKRRLEMQLRRRDVEQWMSHRRLPEELRRQVRQSERFKWAATRGVNEEMLMENLPENLQRDIRRHLFEFVKKVRIFSLMDDTILDAICEKLRHKAYIKGSKILYQGGVVEKMVFIVRGKLDSIGVDGIMDTLSEGDVFGEELLTWYLEQYPENKEGRKIKVPGRRLLCNRTVKCLTNVEAFSLRASDLEEVTALFARFLRNPRVQGAIRYESPYWRGLAATHIQVAWRYRKKRLNRADTSNYQSRHSGRLYGVQAIMELFFEDSKALEEFYF